jgi:hypothetical protein
MSAPKTDPRKTVKSFRRWLDERPEDGGCSKLELHPLEPASARIRNLVEALHDVQALRFFLANTLSLTEAALALRMREEAVLDLMARGEIRGLYVGGERKWLFSAKRVTDLALAAAGLRAADQWFKDNAYRGFGPS